MIKRIWKEPLFHFLAIGLVLYLYTSLQTSNAGSSQARSSPGQPVVTEIDYEKVFEREIGRKPTLLEKKRLRQIARREAALLRYAIGHRLCTENAAIRTMLTDGAKKILLSNAKFKEPSEAALREFYQKHTAMFRKREDVVFVSFEADQSKKEMLQWLRRMGGAFEGGKTHRLSRSEIEAKFGKYFYIQLTRMPLHRWSKALPAKDGRAYYLYIKAVEGEALPFDEVQEMVYDAYRYAQKRQLLESL